VEPGDRLDSRSRLTSESGSDTWVLATRNKGKAVEFEKLLQDYPVEILTLDDIGFNHEIEETGLTFGDNSLLKARAVQPCTEFPVLADDSGLEVNALKGAPGIYSARYAGKEASDSENRNHLLLNMKNLDNRDARFVCCLTLIDEKGKVQTFTGTCSGTISLSSRGDRGFGYDSVFIPEGYRETLGELGYSIKEKLSHRTEAMKKLLRELF